MLGGCGRPLDLGTNIVWSTDFETGDFSPWSRPPGSGGVYVADAGPSDASVTITSEYAHSGRYSAKFASIASTPPPLPYPTGGGGLFKQGAFPPAAYYSAWYYVPEVYETISSWTILSFRVPVDAEGGSDPDATFEESELVDDDASTNLPALLDLIDLQLQSLPGLGLTIVLLDNRRPYLESALPSPVPSIPIGRWFQIECFYHNEADSTGELSVWLNGTQIYDVHRPMSSTPVVYFTPCSLADDLSPSNVAIYVDDVAISRVRVTPQGIITVPN